MCQYGSHLHHHLLHTQKLQNHFHRLLHRQLQGIQLELHLRVLSKNLKIKILLFEEELAL
jgi:hypothetical protein